jgi:hypothetical protein
VLRALILAGRDPRARQKPRRTRCKAGAHGLSAIGGLAVAALVVNVVQFLKFPNGLS